MHLLITKMGKKKKKMNMDFIMDLMLFDKL